MFDTLTKKHRVEYYQGDLEKNEGLKTPDEVHRIDDIVYADQEPQVQKLDLYLPMAPEEQKLPVIISTHGGAWIYGCKEGYQFYCMSLVKHGFAVVNFTYRLCPEHPVTDELEDIGSVVTWVLTHADEYGLDPQRIFMIGDSAGANLTAVYACMCTNPGYRAKFPARIHVPEGFVPTALGLNCGVYDLEYEEKEGDSDSSDMMVEVFQKEDYHEDLWQLNAFPQVTKEFPPSFLITAEDDFLRKQAPLMHEKLSSLGIPAILRDCTGYGRRLWHDFHTHVKEAEANAVNEEECAFFLGIASR